METEQLIYEQKRYFESGATRDVRFRKQALIKLRKAMTAYEEDFYEALKKDLGKSRMESYMCEVGLSLSEIDYNIKHLKGWARMRRVKTPLSQFYSKSFIINEPYGNVLIMAPWNYPVLLNITPLVSAIAAGNCCILKPSAYAPNVSKVIADMIESIFPKEYIAVVEGGREENTKLLEQHFDYIFFTGSVSVGKLVMKKASENLTPVTLELGGKSPCIIDHTADLKVAADRICFGKYLNSGQTCVAPDYVLVESSVKTAFLECIKDSIHRMYGENPLEENDYPCMINEKHFMRVKGLIGSEKIYLGGQSDRSARKIAPTVLVDVNENSPVMQEEIFGPVLPVISVADVEEAINFVKERPRPLALYLFTSDKETEERVIGSISFGGGCINDTIIHLASNVLPFGGVGNSGMGNYHGKFGFETFSHKKSIVKKYTGIDIPIRYRPYTDKKERLLKKIKL